MAINSTDDFLNHRGTEYGDSNYLKSWKDDGSIRVWLHTLKLPQPIWQHKFARVQVRTDKTTKVVRREVWGWTMVCREEEDILKSRRDRKDDGSRSSPPGRCPMCRLSEHVRSLVLSGKVDLTAPLWRIEGDDPAHTRIIYAGGVSAVIGNKMSDADKAKCHQANLRIDRVSGQNLFAKLNYLFAVVNESDPAGGVRFTVETQSLGDSVKKVIRDERTRNKNPDDGDPFKQPYCFEWIYNKKATNPGEYYDARRIDRFDLTPAVRKLITSPPPSPGRLVEPFALDTARSELERHYVGPKNLIDLNYVFDVPGGSSGENDVDEESAGSVVPEEELVPNISIDSGSEVDSEMVECDECGKAIRLSDSKCPYCGKVYVEEVSEPPSLPPPTKLPTRAEAKAAAKAGAKPSFVSLPVDVKKVELPETEDFDF